MFTGLVQAVGTVAQIKRPSSRRAKSPVRLVIKPDSWNHHPALGDSISVNGCCLTVAALTPSLGFDVIPETLSKTSLGRLGRGHKVNLEHAATPTTLMGGHIVQGHVDGLAKVLSIQPGRDHRIRLAFAPAHASLMQFVIPKGSITLDGVSLTIAALDLSRPSSPWFEVALIPTTLAKTNLRALKPLDPVNVEVDLIAKTVIHWLANFQTPPAFLTGEVAEAGRGGRGRRGRLRPKRKASR